MLRRAGQRGVGQQRAGGRCGARRRRPVGRVLGTAHELLGVVGGVVEAALSVAEPLEHDAQQVRGDVEPAGVAGDLVQGEQALGEVGVVLQHAGVSAGRAVPAGAA